MDYALNLVFTLILNYGYPIIFGVILIGYTGVPISLNAVLLAAGAFAVDGTLSLYILIPLVSLTALTGDIFNYILGRHFGPSLMENIARRVGLTKTSLSQVDTFVLKWGSGSIFFTRWLLTPIGIPVNLIAGIRNYPFKKFIVYAGIGELLWAVIYLSLGYIFGANWIVLWEYINDAPQILILLILGIILLVAAWRIWK